MLPSPFGSGVSFSFFTNRPGSGDEIRPGLGTQIRAIADFRSNALIVQAAPRDMAEIAYLIERIDVDDAPSSSEVKVFRLQNALAADLATTLNEAISGTGTTGAQATAQPG